VGANRGNRLAQRQCLRDGGAAWPMCGRRTVIDARRESLASAVIDSDASERIESAPGDGRAGN
jgi:hypothetical protein